MNEESALMPLPEVEGRNMSLSRPLTIEEVHSNLEFVRSLMRREMQEGQDYGTIPGCGPKPTLLQPGAQKLLMTFNLTEEVKKEVLRDFPGFHREYEFTLTVRSGNGKAWDGIGTCSTLESKYRYRQAERVCPSCGKPTIIKGKAEYGGGWLCFKKKGGCGEKWAEGSIGAVQDIESQEVGKMENENPPDQWNTVRKMAFKRALVSAAINATNTSELWTQDLDENGEPEPPKQAKTAQDAKPPINTPPPPEKSLSIDPGVSKPLLRPNNDSKWRMIGELKAGEGEVNRDLVTRFFQAAGALAKDKTIEQIPLNFVPRSAKQMRDLGEAIAKFDAGERAVMPFKHDILGNLQQEVGAKRGSEVKQGWKNHVVLWGSLKGNTLGQLPDDVLMDLHTTFTPNDEGPEQFREQNQQLRTALDAAGVEKGWKRE